MSDEKQVSEILREAGFDIDSASGEWYYGNLYFGDTLSAYAYLRAMQRSAALTERLAELEAALADATLVANVSRGDIDFTQLHGAELAAYFEALKRFFEARMKGADNEH